MAVPDVRTHLAGGLVLLVLAVPWAVANAFAAAHDYFLMPAWLLLAGWLLLSWLGVAYWYFPPFVKRATVSERVALVPVALVFLALVAFAVTALVADVTLARRVFLAVVAAAFVAAAGTLLVPAFRGKPWRGGVPTWRKAGSHQRGDRLAAALAGAAVVQLVLAAVAAPFAPEATESVGLLALVLAAVTQGFAAFTVHLLPRNAKRPVGAAGARAGWGAWALGNAGAVLVAAAALLPLDGGLLATGATATALALVVLAAFVGVTPYRVPGENPGALVVTARPWFTAAGGAFAAAGATLLLALVPAPDASLFAATLVLTLGGTGLLQAGLAVLAWPVMLNAIPAHVGWGHLGAATALVGVLAVAAGAAGEGAAVPAGLVLVAVGAAAHVTQVTPMRTPRRACPPGEEA